MHFYANMLNQKSGKRMAKKKIVIEPSWAFRDETGQRVDPRLFKLLKAIDNHKKLTEAAKYIGLSYRHAWNLIRQWSDFFGVDLVKLEKGRGAYLTPLGEKLVWAEQRVMARFQPQMTNLASELNKEIQHSLASIEPLLTLQASHGYAVELLPALSQSIHIQLDLHYSSPTEALIALNKGRCDIAGFHKPVDIDVPAQLAKYQPYLKPRSHKLIRFITRQQGLMVKPDNPFAIHAITDLQRQDIRFINREDNSGTRALFDQLLQNAGIAPQDIQGYDNHEYTHSAIAAYIAAGMADVGFGVEQAAVQFGLDFIPICREEYLLVCHQQKLKSAVVQAFIEGLKSDVFKAQVSQLAGYSATDSGTITDLIDI